MPISSSSFSLQSLARALPWRRLYATKPPSDNALGIPDLALAARSASAPMQVRRRRAKKLGELQPLKTDATPEGLTPSQDARYKRLVAQGQYRNNVGKILLSRTEYAINQNKRASRIRGFRRIRKDGVSLNVPVGRSVYLPNIVFRLVRNHTPVGEPYNPYEATFRIPNSVTKTDVRSYLAAVYGVKCTYIRTDNYFSPTFPRLMGKKTKSYRTYKRAVVGLVDPFYYPHRLEDMEINERHDREQWIETNFSIQHTRNLQKYELLRMTKGKGIKNWKFKEPFATKRSHILRLVAERRAQREDLVADYSDQIKEMRKSGEEITIKGLQNALSQPDTSSNVPAETS